MMGIFWKILIVIWFIFMGVPLIYKLGDLWGKIAGNFWMDKDCLKANERGE